MRKREEKPPGDWWVLKPGVTWWWFQSDMAGFGEVAKVRAVIGLRMGVDGLKRLGSFVR